MEKSQLPLLPPLIHALTQRRDLRGNTHRHRMPTFLNDTLSSHLLYLGALTAQALVVIRSRAAKRLRNVVGYARVLRSCQYLSRGVRSKMSHTAHAGMSFATSEQSFDADATAAKSTGSRYR